MRVLHIEDDRSVARSIARVLRAEGYEVQSAATRDEVVTIIEVVRFHPDLIVTDFYLGSGDTCEEILVEIAARLHRKVPTILLTAIPRQDLEDAERFADRIVNKPLRIEMLLAEVVGLLQTAKVNACPTPGPTK